MNISGISDLGSRELNSRLQVKSPGRDVAGSSSTEPAQPKVDNTQSGTQKVLDKAEVEAVVNSANEVLKTVNIGLQFAFDKDVGRMVVKLIDSETQDVLKQFPSEEVLALSKALEKMQSALIKQVV